MQTEEYFSVYGSGYSAQRQAGLKVFRESISKRGHTIALGAAVSLLLVGIAQNVMGTAHAGVIPAIRQHAVTHMLIQIIESGSPKSRWIARHTL